MQALQALEWRDPEKHVLALRNLEVRGNEKWLPTTFAALQELSLRGRPRPLIVPLSCQTLSFMYHVRSFPAAPSSLLLPHSLSRCMARCRPISCPHLPTSHLRRWQYSSIEVSPASRLMSDVSLSRRTPVLLHHKAASNIS